MTKYFISLVFIFSTLSCSDELEEAVASALASIDAAVCSDTLDTGSAAESTSDAEATAEEDEACEEQIIEEYDADEDGTLSEAETDAANEGIKERREGDCYKDDETTRKTHRICMRVVSREFCKTAPTCRADFKSESKLENKDRRCTNDTDGECKSMGKAKHKALCEEKKTKLTDLCTDFSLDSTETDGSFSSDATLQTALDKFKAARETRKTRHTTNKSRNDAQDKAGRKKRPGGPGPG